MLSHVYFDDLTTRETQRFISYFDRVFDCLNVRSLSEWKRKGKPNLKPYTLDVSTQSVIVFNFIQLSLILPVVGVRLPP